MMPLTATQRIRVDIAREKLLEAQANPASWTASYWKGALQQSLADVLGVIDELEKDQAGA